MIVFIPGPADVESAFLGSMVLNVILAVIALVVKLAPREEFFSPLF